MKRIKRTIRETKELAGDLWTNIWDKSCKELRDKDKEEEEEEELK